MVPEVRLLFMAKNEATAATKPRRRTDGRLQRFDLVRWFSWVALVAGTAVTLSAAFSLSAFLTSRMVAQEASLTADFVRSVIAADDAYRVFAQPESATAEDRIRAVDVFTHLAEMPDVIRTNVYAADGTVLWSSDAELIGRRFAENDELKEALRAEANRGKIVTIAVKKQVIK